MSSTGYSTSFGGIAGADLEAELAQWRTRETDAGAARAAQTRDVAHAPAALNGAAASGFGRDAGSALRRITDREPHAVFAPAGASLRERVADHAVELRGVRKQFGARTVLAELDLSIERGSFVSIVGRSGCGKSTLLRLIADLETPTAGTVDKRAAGGASNGARFDTRIMFQDARLLPWKSVLQNVMLGLGRGAREDARAVLAEVGLIERANDWPAQLSGGQRQRVALARALVHRPQLLLLDEPLGALDALTRIEMHSLIERLWREHRFTALLVTHDVHEAVALADRILLIEEGRIALDLPVPLARPRERASAGFASLEDRVLRQVLKRDADDGAASPPAPGGAAPSAALCASPVVRASQIRWAV
ncbi:ATP-binding cassette domain-containing protein [Paraburkholderia solisilvae]|uniref:Vitamin B12 import ATP-binding protein BtuD n=1 Tax=Paraburkholderia solisilvae TaxID=624376 RepID=A0A6J5DV20_9BURK|nr:ATP-binding cassette domain-containing protein [Paraburkholderia solisilvae]CAB3758110.1 Vitamin B12 import ATP-binding protein BtuD [Paraburkholderia solisilvae]